jgi:hypothetical protein
MFTLRLLMMEPEIFREGILVLGVRLIQKIFILLFELLLMFHSVSHKLKTILDKITKKSL